MRYMRVDWMHNFEDQPITLYGEVNDAMDEQRRIEVFLDGSMGYASSNGIEYRSFLSELKWSAKEEIEEDPQFQVSYISKEKFEEIWRKALEQDK